MPPELRGLRVIPRRENSDFHNAGAQRSSLQQPVLHVYLRMLLVSTVDSVLHETRFETEIGFKIIRQVLSRAIRVATEVPTFWAQRDTTLARDCARICEIRDL